MRSASEEQPKARKTLGERRVDTTANRTDGTTGDFFGVFLHFFRRFLVRFCVDLCMGASFFPRGSQGEPPSCLKPVCLKRPFSEIYIYIIYIYI